MNKNRMRISKHLLLSITHLVVGIIVAIVYVQSTRNVPFAEQGMFDVVRNIDNGVIEARKVANTKTSVFATALIGFPIVTSAFHGLRHGLPNGTGGSTLRFAEYAITSTAMMYLVGISSGVLGFNELIMLLTLNACTMLLGIVADRQLRNGDYRGAKITTMVAWLLLAAAWLPVIRSFITAVGEIDFEKFPNAPSESTMYGIIISMGVLFSCFGVVQLGEVLQLWGSARADDAYDGLSLVAKTTLVGLIAGGFFGRKT